MNITKEKMNEFSKIFQGNQWTDFAMEKLKLERKDMNPKWEALQKWSKNRSDPIEELRKLKHEFFCENGIFSHVSQFEGKNGKDNSGQHVLQSEWRDNSGERALQFEGRDGKDNSGVQVSQSEDRDGKDNSGTVEEYGKMKNFASPYDDEDIPNIADERDIRCVDDGICAEGDPTLANEDCDTFVKTDNEVYPLSGKKYVLIINNSFDDGERTRKPGCDRDIKRMRELWVEKLQCVLFEETIHEDKNAIEMLQIIHRMSKDIDHKDCAYLVVIVMSHGGSDGGGEYLEGMEGIGDSPNRLYVRLIRNEFNKPKFEGIPKLFIIQGCRGKLFDCGVLADVQNMSSALQPKHAFSDEAPPPPFCDFISIYPSAPHHWAYETIKGNDLGSWLIKALHKVFKEHYKTMHVVDMLTIVNRLLAKEAGIVRFKDSKYRVHTMSEFVSFLTRDLYLDEIPSQ